MSVEINGEAFGILSTGFRRPSIVDLLEQLRTDALNQSFGFGPNADVGAASPLGRFLAVIAQRDDAYWKELEATFYAGYVPTASGAALSLKCAEMGIYRRAATKAWAILRITGDEGTVIPEGDVWQADSGALFEVIEAAIIPARGVIDVKVEAIEAGAAGNVAAGTIATQVVGLSGASGGINDYDPGSTRTLGANDQGHLVLANDGARNDYQTVKLASIEHPYCLDEIVCTVVNDVDPTPFTALFNFHIEVYDHFNGELLGTTETQTFELAAGASRVCTFADQSIDVHGIAGDWIRIVFVNEETSEATLGLAYDDADQYQDGALYLNSVEQAGLDTVMNLTSRLPGASTGGDDGESDTELRLRYLLTSATFGSSTAEAINSQVYRVSGVKSVSIRQNRMDYIVDGMNPHSVEVTVYGGDPDLVAAALMMSVPTGCETLGTSAVTIYDTVNQSHVFRYNKATRVPVYVSITLTVDGSFSHDAALTEMQDAIIGYIGGEDSDGAFHVGLLPAADVIYQRIVALVMAVDGVTDASVTIGVTVSPVGTANLAIDTNEVAETKAAYIVVEVSA